MNSHQYSFIEIRGNIPKGNCYNVKQNDHKCQVECVLRSKGRKSHWRKSTI